MKTRGRASCGTKNEMSEGDDGCALNSLALRSNLIFLFDVQMQTSVQRVQMTATLTPSARTRRSPTTASASRATRAMASSAKVSGVVHLSLTRLIQSTETAMRDSRPQCALGEGLTGSEHTLAVEDSGTQQMMLTLCSDRLLYPVYCHRECKQPYATVNACCRSHRCISCVSVQSIFTTSRFIWILLCTRNGPLM